MAGVGTTTPLRIPRLDVVAKVYNVVQVDRAVRQSVDGHVCVADQACHQEVLTDSMPASVWRSPVAAVTRRSRRAGSLTSGTTSDKKKAKEYAH